MIVTPVSIGRPVAATTEHCKCGVASTPADKMWPSSAQRPRHETAWRGQERLRTASQHDMGKRKAATRRPSLSSGPNESSDQIAGSDCRIPGHRDLLIAVAAFLHVGVGRERVVEALNRHLF